MELMLAVLMLVVMVALWVFLPGEKKARHHASAPSAAPKAQQRA